MVVLILFCGFASLVDANSKKKTTNGGKKQQTLIESEDGMGGVMNERDLKGGKMQQV